MADNSAPAFPQNGFSFEGGDSREGMTLRDWFAGQALAGGMAAADGHNFSTPEKCASMAYEIADAMLATRSGAAS